MKNYTLLKNFASTPSCYIEWEILEIHQNPHFDHNFLSEYSFVIGVKWENFHILPEYEKYQFRVFLSNDDVIIYGWDRKFGNAFVYTQENMPNIWDFMGAIIQNNEMVAEVKNRNDVIVDNIRARDIAWCVDLSQNSILPQNENICQLTGKIESVLLHEKWGFFPKNSQNLSEQNIGKFAKIEISPMAYNNGNLEKFWKNISVFTYLHHKDGLYSGKKYPHALLDGQIFEVNKEYVLNIQEDDGIWVINADKENYPQKCTADDYENILRSDTIIKTGVVYRCEDYGYCSPIIFTFGLYFVLWIIFSLVIFGMIKCFQKLRKKSPQK